MITILVVMIVFTVFAVIVHRGEQKVQRDMDNEMRGLKQEGYDENSDGDSN